MSGGCRGFRDGAVSRGRSASVRMRGSAAVELVTILPFILVLTAAIWDIRAFTAYRTDVAREIYAVAQVIAGAEWSDASPLDVVADQAIRRLELSSAGGIRVAVVTRGTESSPGVPCAAGVWCEPMVTVHWPAAPDDWRAWQGGCPTSAATGLTLPPAGVHFGAGEAVLPNEDDGSAADTWLSRNLTDEDWWVVVDTCSQFGLGTRPGLIGGRFVNLGLRVLDASVVMQRRAVWPSSRPLNECDWC